MKRVAFLFGVLLSFSIAHAEDKPVKKEPVTQQVSAHLDHLNKRVETWQSDSENAGRRSREHVERGLNTWERRWMDFQEQCEMTWHRATHTYQQLRRSLERSIAQVRAVVHQVDSFLHSK